MHNKESKTDVLSHLMKSSDKRIWSMTQPATMSSFRTSQAYQKKKARLIRQNGFKLYYQGEDPDYRFVLECWPDNGTIKRLSVFRDDIGVEYRYLSSHQDAMSF